MPPLHRVKRSLLIATALVLVIGGLVLWRVSTSIGLLFGKWASNAIAERSEGVYQLSLGRVRLHWLQRRITVDSIRFTTNTERNRARAARRTELNVALDGCTMTRLQYVALARGSGLIARSFDCRVGRVEINGVRRAPTASRDPFLVLRESPRPPGQVPRIKIDSMEFPDLAIRARLPHGRRGETRFTLERARWSMADFDMDPGDSATARRPLFSRLIEVVAQKFVMRPDSETALGVADLRASLTDSTLDARDIAFAPTVSDSAFMGRRPWRRDLVRVTGARAQFAGVDFGAFVLGSDVRARRLTVDSLSVQVTSDKRRPPRRQVTRRTPQQWIRDLDQNVIVDSVIVHGGQVIYREQRPNRTGPGAVTFSDIDAVATPVRHVEGRRSRRAPMIFTVKAMLQRVGRLDVRFRVPLDAPTYDLAFRGALGSMPATAFNEFLERVYPWRIERGRVQRIHFDANIQNGVATGTVTPLYTDLSIKVTGRGADGLLGTGGVVGDAARGVASLVANWTEFNERNPAESGKPPRSGAIADTFTRRETLPALVWRSLRGGLLAVVRKEDK